MNSLFIRISSVCYEHLILNHNDLKPLTVNWLIICLLEWVQASDYYLAPKCVVFQLYHGAIKLPFDEMMIISGWILIVLAHWNINNSPRVGMSPHLDTLFWTRVFALTP